MLKTRVYIEPPSTLNDAKDMVGIALITAAHAIKPNVAGHKLPSWRTCISYVETCCLIHISIVAVSS